jgi:hypothetical protein
MHEGYKGRMYFLNYIEVLPDFRRRSLGQALMARVTEQSMKDPLVDERVKGSIFLVPNEGNGSDVLYKKKMGFGPASAVVHTKNSVEYPTGLFLPSQAAKKFYNDTWRAGDRQMYKTSAPEGVGVEVVVPQREVLVNGVEVPITDGVTIAPGEDNYIVVSKPGGQQPKPLYLNGSMPLGPEHLLKFVQIDGKKVVQVYKGPIGEQELDREFDMAATSGGIDFNSDRMDLQRTGQRSEFDWGMSEADLENVEITGLVPVIIQITPVHDLPALMGASQ